MIIHEQYLATLGAFLSEILEDFGFCLNLQQDFRPENLKNNKKYHYRPFLRGWNSDPYSAGKQMASAIDSKLKYVKVS